MYQIAMSRKMENGIVVFWEERGDMKYESFNYQELQDMNINAFDLLDRPASYHVDPKGHKIIVRK